MGLLLLLKKKLKEQKEAKPVKAAAKAKPEVAPAKPKTVEPAGFTMAVVLSEKSMTLQGEGVVTLRVPRQVSKEQVRAEVARQYGVGVLEVRSLARRAKRRRRGRVAGWTAAAKKMYVKVDDVQKVLSYGD